jgi:hypothetical protein
MANFKPLPEYSFEGNAKPKKFSENPVMGLKFRPWNLLMTIGEYRLL